MNGIVKFVISVIVPPAIVYLAYVNIVGRAATQATVNIAENAQVRLDAIAERSRQRAAGSAQQAEDEKRRRLEAEAAATQAAADAARAEQEAAARKEAAWQAFFTPKKVCDHPPDWETQVECGNAYIRAKREFDQRWARGEIR